MTGVDIFLLLHVLFICTSKFKTYHCLSLQNIVLSSVTYSKSKLESVAVLTLEHQLLAVNHCLKHSCKIQYFLALFFYKSITKRE